MIAFPPMRSGAFLLAASLASGTAAADVPLVTVDLPATHALVQSVMGELGEPVPVMTPGASPHDYAMRPSEARALSRSDVVFRIGDALTPWLARAVATLGTDAVDVQLMDIDGTVLLPAREGATFGAGDGESHEHDESHDDDHGPIDPHAWLDPENARTWLAAIASTLGELDPDNADAYAANAARASNDLDALVTDVEARVAPLRGRPYVVAHDVLHYFESRFDLPAAGAVSNSDAAGPGPVRIESLRELVAAGRVECVLTEPGTGARLIEALVAGTDVRSATIDPEGATLAPDADGYARLILGLADALRDCLG